METLMTTYEFIIRTLFESGPIISLFGFCVDNNLDYPWTLEQAHRAAENKHATIRKMDNVRGQPVRLEITDRGRKYAESAILPSFKFGLR
jgi:hypothetical protein